MTSEIPGQAPTPEQAEDTRGYGIILSEVSDETLGDVLRIYGEVFGGRLADPEFPPSVRNFRYQLEVAFPGIRYGSRFSIDTKLYTQKGRDEQGRIVSRFWASTYGTSVYEPSATDFMKEVAEAEQLFQRRVGSYLRDSGTGVPYPRSGIIRDGHPYDI